MAKTKATDPEKILKQYSADREQKFLKTGVIPFDLMFEMKGLPLGVMGHFYSDAGFGKSTLLLNICKNLAKQGHQCWYAAIEPNNKLASDMGLTKPGVSENFFLLDIQTYAELEEVTKSFLESEAELLIIDSITAATPSKQATGEMGIEDPNMAIDARIRSNYLKVYGGMLKRYDKAIIYITHARANFDAGLFGPAVKPEGGYATKHYAAYRFCIMGDARVKAEESGMEGVGILGKKGYLWSEKNRFARQFAKVPIEVIFGKGVSNLYSMLQYLYWKGVIDTAGSKFKINWNGIEEVITGRKARNDWVNAHKSEIMADLESNYKDYFDSLLEGSLQSV